MYIPGVVALWAAFVALVGSTVFYVRAMRSGSATDRAWGRQLYALATFGVILASAILLTLILRHDFRVHYVYSYSDRSLPLGYLIATFWAGQEGSFLLWLFWGMLVGFPLIRYARHYEYPTMVVYNLTQLSLLLILLRQSPFRFLEGLAPGQMPFDGQGLNPLLQNPWMTIHPPIMFLGYASTAVPFAFAIAALWGRRFDEWVKASLPWALVTVVTLGCAILLGGYWAYVTLGWGGYWGWDPVENSSLVPWLASAALVHGMILQRARGRFRRLNFSLAILAYLLVVYATFLTRSGVLADFSVHSFVDLGITAWLVFNLVFFLLLGAGMLAWRWRLIPTQPGDEPLLSRTAFFLVAIAALLGTATMILLGTSSPLITRLFTRPSQVGPAFYNRVTLPIGILLATLLAVVPYLHWRGTSKEFRKRLLTAGSLAALSIAIGVAVGAHGVLYVIFLLMAVFAFFSNLLKTSDEVRNRKFRAAGGYLAHVGLGLMLAGIIVSSAYDRSAKVTLPLGQARKALGYTLTFKGVDRPTPTARQAMLVEVTDPSGHSYIARPHLFRNEKSNQLVANPDVSVHLTHDLYVSPIEFDPGEQPDAANAIQLAKGETTTAGPYTITFDGFDLSGAHGSSAEVSIGARLTVKKGGEEVHVVPMMKQGPSGLTASSVTLPGASGISARLVGIDASAGRIMLAVDGISTGIAKRASLHKGDTMTYAGVTLSFDDFDLSDFDPQAGKIHIGAVFKVTGPHGAAGEITPFVRNTPAGQQHEDVAIPGLDDVRLRILAMNANDQTVDAAILDPKAPASAGEPMRFSVDFTIKPMISLLWLGLLVLLSGGILAMVRRGGEFSSAVSASTPTGA
jgi:cytochrome c-type biogenesis protein CcmF